MGVKERVDLISDNHNLNVNMKPTTVKIELTGVCTLNCGFCFNQIMKKEGLRQSMMSDEMFDKILKSMKKIGSIKEVGLFYMGESGLHPKMPEYYKKLKEEGYFTYLTTNGTILDVILDCIPYVDSLKISWNYKDLPDFIDKTNRTPSLYDKIKSNIEVIYTRCKELDKPLAISTVLDGKKEDYEEVLSELYYDEHYWLPLQTQGGLIEGTDGVVGEYDNQSTPIPCWSLFKGLYFDVDGNVRCCCYGHKNYHILGNILEDDILDIIKSDKLLDMRRKHLDGLIPEECRECLR